MDLTARLAQEGYAELPGFFKARDTRRLLDAIIQTRSFDESLFLSEPQWEASGKSHKHTNPGPGYNVIEKIPSRLLDFIDNDVAFKTLFADLLGEDFSILSKRVICRLPWSSVPEWFRKKRFGKANNALGAFVHPGYRDISYYLDVDMHQDIHDYLRFPAPQRNSDYLTFYVYLDDVGRADAPIELLPESHRFGVTPFQHDVSFLKPLDQWLYRDRERQMQCSLKTLTGCAGYAALWHNCMLHGTPAVHEGHFRLSLRYLVARSKKARRCGIDEINRHVDGSLIPEVDFTPGANANSEGFWNLEMNDYLRHSYRELGFSAE